MGRNGKQTSHNISVICGHDTSNGTQVTGGPVPVAFRVFVGGGVTAHRHVHIHTVEGGGGKKAANRNPACTDIQMIIQEGVLSIQIDQMRHHVPTRTVDLLHTANGISNVIRAQVPPVAVHHHHVGPEPVHQFGVGQLAPVHIQFHPNLPGVGDTLLAAPFEVARQFFMHVSQNMNAVVQQPWLCAPPVPKKMVVAIGGGKQRAGIFYRAGFIIGFQAGPEPDRTVAARKDLGMSLTGIGRNKQTGKGKRAKGRKARRRECHDVLIFSRGLKKLRRSKVFVFGEGGVRIKTFLHGLVPNMRV
ncbi:hypothetical protein ATPR_2855 [Acetobacter tropicalis NBRC 101654]|uniref:Uncharacterized protein n=1 Tax=Acetobacter tropicalis NBRC 101654 TaxID=749388 RepID=F7VHK6_9PROT|nr:hypothetical protein ATPR_2855 [Acetobacter tropicalis NBRC 101654]